MTPTGFDIRFDALKRATDKFWDAWGRERRELERTCWHLDSEQATTGSLKTDYCIRTHGFLWEFMQKRYDEVGAVLAGHTGELIIVQTGDFLPNGDYLRQFDLGILTDDKIDFACGNNCILPTDGYFTHEDLARDVKKRPYGVHERGRFFVPYDRNDGQFILHAMLLELCREVLGGYRPEPWYIIAGDQAVRTWFADERSGIPGGFATLHRLEEKLRSSQSPSSPRLNVVA